MLFSKKKKRITFLLGHWYGTAWNAGGGANKHLAYWMEKPQSPKGE